jgi:tRNA(His) guanylyltransferase
MRGINSVDKIQHSGDLGDRMKAYEAATGTTLNPYYHSVIRISGRGFKKYCEGLNKPFDENIFISMRAAAITFCSEVPGVQLSYVQSDEITAIIPPSKSLWYGGRVQKIVSNSATIFADAFNNSIFNKIGKMARFESRTCNLPADEVKNYLKWRMLARKQSSANIEYHGDYADHFFNGSMVEKTKDGWVCKPYKK